MTSKHLAAFALLSLFVGCQGKEREPMANHKTVGTADASAGHTEAPTGLVPFTSREELEVFLRTLAAEREEAHRRQMAELAEDAKLQYRVTAGGHSPPPPPTAGDPLAGPPQESITNTQTAGVDEGDIVKVHKDHLVVLRRGRLFSIRIGEKLEKSSQTDAFGPALDPAGAWYDELLVAGDRIVVIGYSARRGGTELGLFNIDDAGTIRHQGTYHLRADDYYSSRNYASRLIGDKLVFYTPRLLEPTVKQPRRGLPALRAWREGVGEEDFHDILEPHEVYRPLRSEPSMGLHTITVCDLSKPGALPCRARAVMGPPGRVFYMSNDAVYVWTGTGGGPPEAEAGRPAPSSLLYRLPLGVGPSAPAPSVLRVRGAPIDQFSFLERDGHLNVLVAGDGGGDAMWAAEQSVRSLALLRIPLTSFSRAGALAPDSRYHKLADPPPDAPLHNRYVGDYLLYGVGQSWGSPSDPRPLAALAYAKPEQAPTLLPVGHTLERIEALGGDALAVGSKGNALVFTALALQRKGEPPQIAGRYTLPRVRQGESRSHGFFYSADDAEHGVFALPVRGANRHALDSLTSGSARLVFVKNDKLSLRELGVLTAQADPRTDGCRASCVDWYGNARPIFWRGRLFGLLGYELVEGRLRHNEVNEFQRLDFTPDPRTTPPRCTR